MEIIIRGGKEMIGQAVTVPAKFGPLAGVVVVYDVMAPQSAVDRFIKYMAGPDEKGEPTAPACVIEVRGWPADLYGENPWSKEAPGAFHAWATRTAWAQAVREFVSGPN